MTTRPGGDRGLLSEPHPHNHIVKLYLDSESLAASVCVYVAAGVGRGDRVRLIATPHHWELVADGLRLRGVDPTALCASGQLQVRSAADTLESISTGGVPDRVKFDKHVREPIRADTRAHGASRVRVFGEMVDLLWQAGDLPNAMKLEGYWHALLDTSPFPLFCAYRLALLDEGVDAAAIEAIYEAHTHTLLGSDPRRLQHAVDRAMDEVVGPDTARALRPLIAATLRSSPPSDAAAQHTLLWVRKNLPSLAARVLSSARGHYGLAA